MSQPLSKEALLRATWLTELRRQGHRQCIGSLTSGSRVCALGLLAEIARIDCIQLSSPLPEEGIGALVGLTQTEVSTIVYLNDIKNLPFSSIALKIESWFPEAPTAPTAPERKEH